MSHARVYSRLIYSGPVLARDIRLEPPPGTLWVLRDIELLASLDTTGGFLAGGPGGWFYFHQWTVANAETAWHQWQGRVVVPAGGNLQLHADLPVTAYVTGYELLSD